MNLREQMREMASKLANRASGFRMCGEHELANDHLFAGEKLIAAARALDIVEGGVRAARIKEGKTDAGKERGSIQGREEEAGADQDGHRPAGAAAEPGRDRV